MSTFKACLVLVLLGVSVFGGSAQFLGRTEEVTPALSFNPKAPSVCTPTQKDHEQATETPRGVCYASETKTVELRAQITSLVRALNADGDDQHHHFGEEQVNPFVGENEEPDVICSTSRINQITEDLGEVASQLWSLSNRLQNVSGAELQKLDVEKGDLIQRLREIRVFIGPQLTSKTVLSKSFETQVELLELSLNSALAMLHNPRPARPPIEFKKPLHPTSKAIARISDQINAMYAGSLRNFDRTLEFIKGKSSQEQQILGYVALYKEMEKHSHRETFELTKLAAQVQRAKDQLTSAVSDEARSKLTKLTVDIGPVMKFFSGRSTCRFTNVAVSLDLWTAGDTVREKAIVVSPSDTFCQQQDDQCRVTVEPRRDALVRLYSIEYGTPFYATEGDTLYSYGREIMVLQEPSEVPAMMSTGFLDWKLVPVNRGQQFRILSAQHNEVMFVSTRTYFGYNHVFLMRHDYSGSVEITLNDDLWNIDCS